MKTYQRTMFCSFCYPRATYNYNKFTFRRTYPVLLLLILELVNPPIIKFLVKNITRYVFTTWLFYVLIFLLVYYDSV